MWRVREVRGETWRAGEHWVHREKVGGHWACSARRLRPSHHRYQAIAPSKDTLWTRSPQPPTSSDFVKQGYDTQPHVQLDAVLATLSLGPVGISDGLNQTDAGLIRQAFRCARDGTLLRPSRPLSLVDGVFANRSATGAAADVRSTHAAVPSARGPGPGRVHSHYVVAWRTTAAVTLQATDLYPPPPPGVWLAVRRHVVVPAGDAQLKGCEDGAPAASCVDLLRPGHRPVIPPTGGAISDFSLTAVYEPLANGAYFVGELEKFVHVSPQRFEYVVVQGDSPCGLIVGVRGAAEERVRLVCVDPLGIVHRATVDLPRRGFVEARV